MSNNSRNELKICMLQCIADKINSGIEKKLQEVDKLTTEYSTVIDKITALKGTLPSKNEHCYSESLTTEEMLQHATRESDKNKKSSTSNLPEIGDNDEIWERIALAHKNNTV